MDNIKSDSYSFVAPEHQADYLAHIDLWKNHWVDHDYFGAGYWLSQNYKLTFSEVGQPYPIKA